MDNLTKVTLLRQGKYVIEDVDNIRGNPNVEVVDIYKKQLRELFEIQNPELVNTHEFDIKFLEFESKKTQKGNNLSGDWIFYEWSKIFLHCLTEEENDLLRTNRNRNIINLDEQKTLRDFTVAIAGLSVGSNIASTLLYNGFPKQIKLADLDTLETTNLNRVRSKLSDVGKKKIDVISRELLEVDPYINIDTYLDGINRDNVASFVSAEPRPKLIFEIIDDFEMKVLIRREARKHKIPVVMLTSLGDSILVDVERYDIDSSTEIFNGEISEKVLEDITSGEISEKEKNDYALKIVGIENVPEKVVSTLKEIGTTLVGRPQLMSTITIESGLAAVIARKIALNEPVITGRECIKFDDLIGG